MLVKYLPRWHSIEATCAQAEMRKRILGFGGVK